MHKTRLSRIAVALAVCLLMTFALGAISAHADDWGSGPKTLTVTAGDEIKEDIATAGVVVDVYKIADATRDSMYLKYNYDLISPFLSDEIIAAMEAGKWADLADEATKVVKATIDSGGESTLVHFHGELDETMSLASATDEGDGVYLVLPHGVTEDTCSLIAKSKTYVYTFSPSIIALPTKDAVDEEGHINSAVGNWIPDAEIVLKASRELRFGTLQIDKHVTDFAGEPATFVFHVVDTETGGDIYDNYASVYYDGGDSHSTTLTQIPGGLQLTITEVYTGARFEADGSTTASATIVSGETVTVSFNNKRNGSGKGGHGIENHFEYGEDGDWHWTATPADSAEAA